MTPDRVNAAHAQGVYIGGDGIQINNFHPAPRQDVVWPVRSGVVPPLADCLQHRQAEQHALSRGHGATVVLTQILSGLGGVGKTQLAAGWAEHFWRERQIDLLVWVTADSRESIVAGYARAAQDIGVDAGLTGEDAATRLLVWLAGTDRRWLIVLDDLSEPADLRGWWPPTSGGGSTVVTTRLRDAALSGYGRRLVPIGLFTDDEADQYVTAKLAGRPHLADDIEGLASDLGRLPLALAQATAYMINRRWSCTRYRQQFSNRRRRLSELLPETRFLPDDHQATVAVTWSLSVERANELDPPGLARPLLQLASLLDPNGIPANVLTADATISWLNKHRDSDKPVTGEDVIDAVSCLQRLNLATYDPDNRAQIMRVHALVQRATRDQTPDTLLDTATVAAADALVEAWPQTERDTDLCQTLRANTTVLAAIRPESLFTPDDDAHPVLFRAGRSLGEIGQVTAAADHFQQLHAAVVERLGPNHQDTLASRSHFARWRGEAGDPVGAVAGFEALLADLLRVLGPDHPSVLASRGNLARWRGMAGDPVGAVAAFEALLADLLRVLGSDHPNALTTRSNLAYWRGEAGDPVGAVAAFEALLADLLRVLGPDHPDTLTTRGNLARWRGEAGDPVGAAAAFEALVADRLRVLGSDHPDTLASRSNLAYWRGEAGDPVGAGNAFEALLADLLRVLGPDHPDTLTTRSNLAHSRGDAGDPVGAAAAFEALVADLLRVLGPDHPSALASRGNLARWQGAAGDPVGAVAAHEALLADLLRVLGPDHPDTLTTRSNLAHSRGQAGDPVGAATAFEALLADRLRVLGPDHPNTLTTRDGLAFWQSAAGDGS